MTTHGGTTESIAPGPVEIAHVFPWASWDHPRDEFLKALLLFFDGMSVLLPEREWARKHMETELTGLLVDQGLLELLDPSKAVGNDTAETLLASMKELVRSGCFESARDDLREHGLRRNHRTGKPIMHDGVPLLREKFGAGVDPTIPPALVSYLVSVGLAGVDEDAHRYVKVPRYVADTMLTLLGQTLPGVLTTPHRRQHPVTKPHTDTEMFARTTALNRMDVVQRDLMVVNSNIADVPLHDVLDFRSTHREELATYLEEARRYATDVTSAATADREEMFRVRRQALERALEDFSVTRLRRSVWKQTALALSLASAGWGAARGDVLAGVLAASAAVAAAAAPDSVPATPYSYLVRFTTWHS